MQQYHPKNVGTCKEVDVEKGMGVLITTRTSQYIMVIFKALFMGLVNPNLDYIK